MKNAVDLSCRLTLFVSDVMFDLPLTSRTMTPNCEATAMTSGGDAGEPRDVTRSRDHRDDVMAKRRRKIKLAIIGITLLLILFTYLLIYFMPVIIYSTVDIDMCDFGRRHAVHVSTHR